jgi:hypothetical protein
MGDPPTVAFDILRNAKHVLLFKEQVVPHAVMNA